MQLAFQLLRKNYELVHRLDELKELSFQAYLTGDQQWQHELAARISELEKGLIQRPI
jgi:hypothetical protein